MFLLESRLSPEQRAVMMRVQGLAAAMGFNLLPAGAVPVDYGRIVASWILPSRKSDENGARMEKGGAKILDEDEKAAAHRYCSRATSREVFRVREMITMFGRGRGRRFGGRRSWRICGGAIFR